MYHLASTELIPRLELGELLEQRMALLGSAWTREFVSTVGVKLASFMLLGFPAAGFPRCSSHVCTVIAEQWAPATLPVQGTSAGLMETTAFSLFSAHTAALVVGPYGPRSGAGNPGFLSHC